MKPLALSEAKDIAEVVGAVIALVTLAIAVLEYRVQGAQKRFEQFQALRRRFKENESFKKLLALAEHNDAKLATENFADKRDLLGFFEEVAIAVNSGIVRPDVAHYMFGYYAIRVWRSDQFWDGVNRQSYYWHAFTLFVARMQQVEDKQPALNTLLRF